MVDLQEKNSQIYETFFNIFWFYKVIHFLEKLELKLEKLSLYFSKICFLQMSDFSNFSSRKFYFIGILQFTNHKMNIWNSFSIPPLLSNMLQTKKELAYELFFYFNLRNYRVLLWLLLPWLLFLDF